MSLFAVGLGYLAAHRRDARLGRGISEHWFLAVLLAVLLLFGWLHVKRVRSLPRVLPAGGELIGYTLGGFEVAALTARESHRLVNTGVVGLVLLDGRLGVLVDRPDARILTSSAHVRLELGTWRRRYWLLATNAGHEVSVRVWRPSRDRLLEDEGPARPLAKPTDVDRRRRNPS